MPKQSASSSLGISNKQLKDFVKASKKKPGIKILGIKKK